jgi:CTP synthase
MTPCRCRARFVTWCSTDRCVMTCAPRPSSAPASCPPMRMPWRRRSAPTRQCSGRGPTDGEPPVRNVGPRDAPTQAVPQPPRHDVPLNPVVLQTTKQIFVTGGVASSLGKGLTASSLGHLLRARGLRVTMQKLDPYLNVDPGTMNPFQHGEVFVTDDGAETDLDIGHYERFLDVALKGSANVTTGQVYNRVIAKRAARGVPRRHRPGDPAHHQRAQGADARPGRRLARGLGCRRTGHHHHRDRWHRRRHRVAALPRGRPPGAPRPRPGQLFFLHVSLVPYLAPSGELKTKPTQHSVAALRQVGIQPDALVLRATARSPNPSSARSA